MEVTIPVREKWATIAGVVTLASFTACFFGPLQMYLTNRIEFFFSPVEILPFLLGISLFCALALAAVLAFLGPRLFRRCAALLFAAGLLLWIQGNLLVWHYGVLDGGDIFLKSGIVFGVIDGAVWILVLLLALMKSSFVYRISRKGSAALLLIQCGVLAVTVHQGALGLDFRSFASDERVSYEFSPRRNVVILILDAFQSDLFQELLDEDGSLAGAFPGFTFFRNALSGYPNTYTSVPLMLTGRFYDNSVPIREYIRKEFITSSLPAILRRNGYRVYLPPEAVVLNDPAIADNFIPKRSWSAPSPADIAYLYDFTLFRYMPHFVKEHVYRQGRWFLKHYAQVLASRRCSSEEEESGQEVSRDIPAMRSLISSMTASCRSPTFKVLHFKGAHPPFILNENLEYEPMEFDRAGYRRQGKGVLRLAKEFLDALERKGLYDDSMIIIVGDHGVGFEIPPELARPHCPLASAEGEGSAPVHNRVIARGVPLVLVKPFGARGAMRVSDAPVSLGDVPATVLAGVGIAAEVPGDAMFSVSPSAARERRFMYYNWDDRWNDAYVPTMREYIVNGFSWCRASWHYTGRHFYSPARADAPRPYRYGTAITFGVHGSYRQYGGDTWRVVAREPSRSFPVGHAAALVISVRPAKSGLMLRASLFANLGPGPLERQRVEIAVNERKVGTWEVDPLRGKYEMLIPQSAVPGPVLYMSFNLPDAVSPLSLGLNDDPAPLSIAVESLRIDEPEPGVFGKRIGFGKGGSAEQYEMEGWSFSERGFTWTDGDSATMGIPLAEAGRDVTLIASVKPCLVPGKIAAQRAIVRANGQKVAEWDVRKDGEYRATIPGALTRDGALNLRFDLPNAVRLADERPGGDTRLLGLRFYWLRLDGAPHGAT